jgi:DNA-binding FrmR family transcriptional regulator
MADHKTVARLVRNAQGQLDAVLRMIEEDRYCIDVSNQLLAAQSLIKKANRTVLQGHLEHCVKDAMTSGDQQEMDTKVQELMDAIDKMNR